MASQCIYPFRLWLCCCCCIGTCKCPAWRPVRPRRSPLCCCASSSVCIPICNNHNNGRATGTQQAGQQQQAVVSECVSSSRQSAKHSLHRPMILMAVSGLLLLTTSSLSFMQLAASYSKDSSERMDGIDTHYVTSARFVSVCLCVRVSSQE